MQEFSRRTVLELSLPTVTALAGCSSLPTQSTESPNEARIADELVALNYTDEPRRLHFRIDDADEMVYKRVISMDAGESRDGTEHLFRDLPDAPGQYLATAWLEGGERTPETGFSTTDISGDCLKLGVQIEQRGTPEPSVAVTGGSWENCGSDSS